MNLPRPEYPRPQLVRDEWTNLNGPWHFAFDDQDLGISSQWYSEGNHFPLTILVPFPYQSKLSGHGTNDIHDIVWYRRSVTIDQIDENQRVLLHFGAVDYAAHVWINGELARSHEGGQTAFAIDITRWLKLGENIIVVRAEDPTSRMDQPRGKQYWEPESASIFYTRTTGIWQTVWLEAVSSFHLRRLKLTPDVHSQTISLECDYSGFTRATGNVLDVRVSLRGDNVITSSTEIMNDRQTINIALPWGSREEQEVLWSPEHPNLFDMVLIIRDSHGDILDKITSYFGMRSVNVQGGKIMLNSRPYYMKLVLDQGYFPDGILTPPSDDAIRHDVELTKQLGFNGARKHQKVEDPRYLYWCDHMGLLVWGEMANCFAYSDEAVRRMTTEWQEVVERDYNHPCIVAWVPVNESWGVPQLLDDSKQQAHTVSLYYLTKSLDSTRLVVSNDGWEHTRSDLITIHDYESRKDVLQARYHDLETALHSTPGGKLLMCESYPYQGQPLLVTEFGGIAFNKSGRDGWGYSEVATDEEFTNRFKDVTEALLDSPAVQGYCYTQLTDVEQELNGLLTYDRVPKISLDVIRRINQGAERKN